jgi:hypothetical protein
MLLGVPARKRVSLRLWLHQLSDSLWRWEADAEFRRRELEIRPEVEA